MRLRRQTLFCEHIRSAWCGVDDVGSTWSISVCVSPDWSHATEVSAWECSPVWGGSTVPSLPSDDSDTQREGKDMAITDLIAIPKDLNPGVSSAKQITMLTLLGNPPGSRWDRRQENVGGVGRLTEPAPQSTDLLPKIW